MKRVLSLFALSLGILQVSYGQNTCIAQANGNWNNNATWTDCGGGIPQDGDIVRIPPGWTVTVNAANQYSANGNAPYLIIYVGDSDTSTPAASINFSGKLNLQQGSPIVVYSGASTSATGPGNSEKIVWWNADDSQAGILEGDNTAFTGPVTVSDGEIDPGINDPLPVELVSFRVIKHSSYVLLEWSTATELNNSHFEVQRSFNGRDFDVIGQVEGHGTTNEPNYYSFIDRSPVGAVAYFRLRQVDYDGAYEFSPIRLVQQHNLAGTVVSTYPNPAREKVYIQSVNALEFSQLQLINLSGQVVSNLKGSTQGNGFSMEVMLPQVPKGMYYVRYTTMTGETGVQKLLID
jgi:hypothetical protein